MSDRSLMEQESRSSSKFLSQENETCTFHHFMFFHPYASPAKHKTAHAQDSHDRLGFNNSKSQDVCCRIAAKMAPTNFDLEEEKPIFQLAHTLRHPPRFKRNPKKRKRLPLGVRFHNNNLVLDCFGQNQSHGRLLRNSSALLIAAVVQRIQRLDQSDASSQDKLLLRGQFECNLRAQINHLQQNAVHQNAAQRKCHSLSQSRRRQKQCMLKNKQPKDWKNRSSNFSLGLIQLLLSATVFKIRPPFGERFLQRLQTNRMLANF
jgi:hypothetical protein